jgi:hypothetical protein
MSIIFPDDFFANSQNYTLSLRAWEALIASISNENEGEGRWEKWLQPREFDSPLGLDSSPICSFLNASQSRGVLVYGLSRDAYIDFAPYMKVIGEVAVGEESVETLVLHVAPQGIVKAEKLLRIWISGACTYEAMQRKVEEE